MTRALPIVNERCVGACCVSFCLPVEGYADLMRQAHSFEDGDKVLAMALPRMPSYDYPFASRFGCRHHDHVTGDCTNYADRPGVCRRHGVDYACDQTSCPLPSFQKASP